MSITHLYVDRRSIELPATQIFIKAIGMPPKILDDSSLLFNQIKASADPWGGSKKHLLLTHHKGSFIKECPGTKEYRCCGYQIMQIGSYCTMDCSYCILQSYFHPPILQYFVNHEDLIKELDKALIEPKLRRIGTGEFTDSLIWEKWSDLTQLLIQRFANQTHAVLELKTKTVAIEKLQGLSHNKKTIVAWSLNTPHIIATQERGTASLKARLKAASQCELWGYPLAFHFDPMVIYPGCEKDYRLVLEMLFKNISADSIVWISLGTFRFIPALKSVIEKRFSDASIAYGEFIPGLDGKMRYFKPLRINLYKKMVGWIREMAPKTTTYLCMEDDQVWKQSYGFIPKSEGGLSMMLDECAQQHCGLFIKK